MSNEVMNTNEQHEVSLFDSIPEELRNKLTPAKFRVVNLYLTGLYSKKQIAELMGMHPNGISNWLRLPEIQEVIRIIQEREFAIVDSNLKNLRFKAVDTLGDLMENAQMETVRFSAAKDILDRTGHKSVQQIKVDKKVTNIEQQLKNISEFNYNEDDVIDIDDIVQVIKDE